MKLFNNQIMYQLKMNGGKKASFQNYIEANKNVEGVNWEVLDKDRKQVGSEPANLKTQYKNAN